MEEVTLYHGSDIVVQRPLVGVGRKDLDFGPGFYLTPYSEQASRWATRIKTIRRSLDAVVNVYAFALPDNCCVRRFDAYDRDWLDFIVDSRTGRQPWRGYDVIEGGVADDRVIDAVEAYVNGYADVAHTLRQLVYHKPNRQVCILSQDVADRCLRFLRSERI